MDERVARLQCREARQGDRSPVSYAADPQRARPSISMGGHVLDGVGPTHVAATRYRPA